MDGEVELERRLVMADGADRVGILVQGSEGFSGLLWGTRLWTSSEGRSWAVKARS